MKQSVKSVVNKDIENSISKILITKVLLGTLGCTPAYDRFFIIGARKTKVTSGLIFATFNEKIVCIL